MSADALRLIARQAAKDVYRLAPNYYHPDEVNQVADAVAVAVGQAFVRYRPQHDDGCNYRYCRHCGHWFTFHTGGKCDLRMVDTRSICVCNCSNFEPKPCSCGLDALLSSLRRPAIP
jgi:hypothetical protein